MNRFARLMVLLALAALMAGCYTATVLPDGRVFLVAGVAKLYDPGTGTISVVGMPTTIRAGHTATLLADGRVLLAGGIMDEALLDSTEIYDPGTGTFTPGAPMTVPRGSHTATLLPDGRVLLVGGGQVSLQGEAPPALATAELFDPGNGTFTATGSLTTGRYFHSAVPIADGRVLIVGGSGTDAPIGPAEVYDPGSGTFATVGALAEPRLGHTATLLNDGRVLVAGGLSETDAQQGVVPLATTELYDPGAGTFAAGATMTDGRLAHTATLLGDGRVLIVGGSTQDVALTSAELYDPASDTFAATGDLPVGRTLNVAALLSDGRVLVAGIEGMIQTGESGQQQDPLGTALIYDPGTGTFTPIEVEQFLFPSPSPS